MLNLINVQVGQTIRLKNGAVAEVTENIGDGIWLQLRNPESGEEELVHCEEMLELVEQPTNQPSSPT
ncbi:hypothetical protein EJP69_14475 [Variovorax gossypii]|uniref:Uncharacterized protein n=1 Tax=Variovorax gossypii TaxID=1679495 RepID=A0A3S0IFM6_9BURK|nr:MULTISPECIES: hypothetical protein [Variovorax]MDR6522142.1 hypothetical protein [Variovorax paradoxus]RTQ35558.1 hypothetical protein EJP69_14475 [Variovorax gossypii]